jgi:hypothetical protein
LQQTAVRTLRSLEPPRQAKPLWRRQKMAAT